MQPTAPERVMNPDRWKRIEELFDQAFELDAAARAALLASVDAELRKEVESLLASSSGARESLHHVVATETQAITNQAAAELIGTKIGTYTLREVLGEGGMGAVYLAERADDVPHRVAIKVLHRGLGPQATARFRDERRILADLDHPNIVKLLDGGQTMTGLPYLVMELVAGAPLVTYARELSVAARAALFIHVCNAVQYAHSRFVVHRDLKPTNVLVTTAGVPKLLDFGIAKILDADTPREAHTRTGMLLLTPEYASPEQVRGEPATVATDVYGLGAVLYELLADRAPLTPPSNAAELARFVSEIDPPRPSTVATSATRATLVGDLDNIVLKALHKDPAKRYASAADLADDLQRYLDGKPVRARTPTLRYRARKFVRRHRNALAIGAGIAAALSITVSVVTVVAMSHDAPARACHDDRAMRVWADRKAAIRATLLAKGGPLATDAWSSVERALDRYATQWGQMHESACLAPQSEALLDLRMRCLDTKLEELTALTKLLSTPDASLVDTASRAAQALGRLDACNDTAALQAPVPLPASPIERGRVVALRNELAHVNVLGYAGRYDAQLAALATLVPQAKALGYAPLVGDALAAQASALDRVAKFPEAVATMKEAGYASDAGGDRLGAARARAELVWLVGHQLGQPQQGLEYARDAEARIRGLGGNVLLEAKVAANEGQILEDTGKQQESNARGEKVLAMREAALGPDDVQTAIARVNTAVGFVRVGQVERAVPYFERALVTYRMQLGEHHPLYAHTLFNIADSERILGRYREGRAHAELAHKLILEALGPEHNLVASCDNILGLQDLAESRYADAEARFRNAIRLAEKLRGPEHMYVANYGIWLAQALRAQGDAKGAYEIGKRAKAIYDKLQDPGDADRALTEMALAQAMLGDRRAAASTLEAVLARDTAEASPDVVAEMKFALAQVVEDKARAKAFATEALRDGDAPLRGHANDFLKNLH